MNGAVWCRAAATAIAIVAKITVAEQERIANRRNLLGSAFALGWRRSQRTIQNEEPDGADDGAEEL